MVGQSQKAKWYWKSIREARDVNQDVVKEKIDEVRKNLEGYDPETGMKLVYISSFCQAQLTLLGMKNKSVRGTKAQKAKDRVTLY